MFTGCNFDTIISCLYFELLIHDVFDKGWVTQSNKDQSINQSLSLLPHYSSPFLG